MLTIHLSVEFNDLSDDKKEELVDHVVVHFKEAYKEEVAEAVKNDERGEFNEGMTWQEVICRINLIDYQMWDESEEEAKEFDWEYAVQTEIEEKAEKELYRAMKHLEIEVEI